MNIYKQVATYEQSKTLYELGISKTGHLFSWVYETLNERWDIGKMCVEANELCKRTAYPAFTVAELGQMLGRFARNTSSICDDGNEAFDRADDLIHLIEIGELLVDSCNERLNEN